MAGNEFTTAQRAFVVKQDTAATKNTVAFAVVDGHPMCVEFGHAIGAAWVKWSFFNLGDSLYFAKHL